MMDNDFLQLANKLLNASDQPYEGTVNVAKCQVEAEIIGYLLGRKVAMDDAKFVPDGIDKYHTLPLRSLNQVASAAFDAYKKLPTH